MIYKREFTVEFFTSCTFLYNCACHYSTTDIYDYEQHGLVMVEGT